MVSGDGCPTANGSVISAISFYGGGSYPGTYNGALFFGDHSRNCIWAMLPGGNGLPNSNNLQAFVVDPERLHHKNPLTPYDGHRLLGVVRGTWLRGEELAGERPRGQLLTRGGA